MFLDCVQRIALIQLGNNFTSDFVSWHLQLRATEHRLRRWGKAAGILDEQSTPFWKQPDAGDNSQRIREVCHALKQIAKQLSRAEEDSDEMLQFCDREELNLIDELEQLSLCESDAKEARQALKGLSSRYQSSVQMTREVIDRSIFALYRPDQLQRLLDAIGDHVHSLETFFSDRLSTLVAQEKRGLKPEAIQALALGIQITLRDPILASALEEALPKHSRWEKITIKDNSHVQLGSRYSERRQEQGSSSWRDLIIGGYSDVHAGHTFGY
jgi:hypothetical protein